MAYTSYGQMPPAGYGQMPHQAPYQNGYYAPPQMNGYHQHQHQNGAQQNGFGQVNYNGSAPQNYNSYQSSPPANQQYYKTQMAQPSNPPTQAQYANPQHYQQQQQSPQTHNQTQSTPPPTFQPAASHNPNNDPERRPGDWDCPACGALCFASKTACFKCGEPRPASAGRPPSMFKASQIPRRPGDWDCPCCTLMCFASKTECPVCGTKKPIPPLPQHTLRPQYPTPQPPPQVQQYAGFLPVDRSANAVPTRSAWESPATSSYSASLPGPGVDLKILPAKFPASAVPKGPTFVLSSAARGPCPIINSPPQWLNTR